MRNLFAVQILLNGGISWGTDRAEDGKDFVALHKTPRLLKRLRRTICVVVADEVDLASVDAALIVHHPEKRGLHLPDGPIKRDWPAVRRYVADLDLGVGRSGIILWLRAYRIRQRHGKPNQAQRFVVHCALLPAPATETDWFPTARNSAVTGPFGERRCGNQSVSIAQKGGRRQRVRKWPEPGVRSCRNLRTAINPEISSRT